MATITSNPYFITESRRRAFVFPREHGAWRMLLVPLVTGAVAGRPEGNRIAWIFLFAAAALGLFCLRTPMEAALGYSPLRPQNEGERRVIHHFIFLYASIVVLALTGLTLWAHAYGLLLLGAAAAIVFLLQLVLKQPGPKTRMNA